MIGLILESRFPGMVSAVNILNFGWMYQGIWTVVKYLLSEEAKESIQFTTVIKLNPYISSDAILQEMGGDDAYQWSLETDTVLEKYGSGKVPLAARDLPNTPPLSEGEKDEEDLFTTRPHPLSEEHIASSNSSSSSDIFFDANDSLSMIPSTTPNTPTQLIPPSEPPLPPLTTQPLQTTPPPLLTSPTTLPGPTTAPIPHDGHLTTTAWVGLRMGVDFLTSFIDTKAGGRHQRDKKIAAAINNVHTTTTTLNDDDSDTSVIVVNKAMIPNNNEESITAYPLQRVKKWTHRLMQVSLGQHGLVCWVLLYFFLRVPVESFVQKTLSRTSLGPQRIKSTTIGITAAVSAVVSSSISSTIENSFK